MAEMTKPVQNNNDEIDLIKVLERIFNFLSSYKKMLIIATLAGILCGLALYLIQPKIYGSTLILHSQVLSNSEEIEIIDNWNNLRREGEYGVLSRNLNCPVALLNKVKSIAAANIQINQPTSGFTVEVFVTDTAVLEELQKAIIYGLENNEFVKE
jgi:predicted cobalt transporter CbtA